MMLYKVQMFFAGLFVVISTVCLVLTPYILGLITDKILEIYANGKMQDSVYQDFLFSTIFLCITYIGYSIFEYLRQFTPTYTTEHTFFDLHTLVDSKNKKLPLNYYDTHAVDDALSRVTNDINVIASALQQSAYISVNSFVKVFIMFIMMLLINPALIFIAVIVIPLSLFIAAFIVKKVGKHFKGRQVNVGDLNGFVEESYKDHNVIRACNKEEKVKGDFDSILERLYSHSWRADFVASALMPITMSHTNFAHIVVTLITSFMVISRQFSIGIIQGFTQYLRNFSQPITDLTKISNIFQQARATAARVFEFVNEREETPNKQDCVVPKDVKGIVVFKHVECGYTTPDKILIHDLSVNINPGDKITVVGPTGAYKTTLVNLQLCLYKISKGQISIDGISTTDMMHEILRSNVSIVLQDVWLFSGTFKENIRYGRLDATNEEAYAAAKEVQGHDFIKKLPGSYGFKLSESASSLAQGQKQLMTITRTIVPDCPILIMDEATSSVDTRTKLIQRAMASLTKNRASFVIAHRLSTIRDSELILYMQDNNILKQGNHHELMDKDGLCARPYNSQF
ncbi:MAG: ABC transporter ATP-binding protein [Eggerthellaceae bacterium]|nr:ABC transporter ATP-binding protein [Eggerthellaceae bacterium]